MQVGRRLVVKLLSLAVFVPWIARADTGRRSSEPPALPSRCVYEGYLDRLSYVHRNILRFRLNVNTTADPTALQLGIFRITYGAPDGERLISLVRITPGRNLQYTVSNPATGLIECSWPVSRSVKISEEWQSGLYVARFCLNGKPFSSSEATPIPFIVRGADTDPDIIVQTSDQTWQAYNYWGGAEFYNHDERLHRFGIPGGPNLPFKRALQISERRPYLGDIHFFEQEKALALWLQKHRYDAEFWSAEDIATKPIIRRRGKGNIRPKLLISVGHDEYWTIEQRRAFESARESGVNLLFLSGDTCFWQIQRQFKTSAHVMTCFKEPWIDPATEPQARRDYFRRSEVQAAHRGKWSGAWRDDRRNWMDSPTTSEICVQPDPNFRLVPAEAWGEWSLTGLGWRYLSEGTANVNRGIEINGKESQTWVWQGTSLSGVGGVLAPGILGHEVDGPFDGMWGSPDLLTYSTTNLSDGHAAALPPSAHRIDNGDTSTCYKNGPVQHHIVSFKSKNSMTVSVGTTKWCQFLMTDPDVSRVTENFFTMFRLRPQA